jgi:uncharacterized protein (DUF1800 family)
MIVLNTGLAIFAVAEIIVSIDPKSTAALGLHRFGFGPVREQIGAIADDPRGALLADLERPSAGQVTAGNLPASAEAARALFEYRAEQQATSKLEERAKKAAEAKTVAMAAPESADPQAAAAMAPEQKTSSNQPPAPQPLQLPAQLIQNEAKVRFDAAIGAEVGFVERLVWFWSNHFCISADKILSMAGAYEREAIRPHVLGRFSEMLQAVESHPAMLFYLDNVESMGANSIAGINRDRGLNENLAREILELHTLGVRSGYSQADVTSFANVITGWTWFGPGEPLHGGEFLFFKRFHEPGEQTVLGKRYPDTGLAQGRAVLADLARHPATAQHIAQKFARHFVADEPPPALVAKLEKSFKDTGGDLKELAKTLIAADESWAAQRNKLKSPSEWIAGALRLTNAQGAIPIGRVLAAQATLGQALWRPPSPNGYPDSEAAWIDGVPRRLDIANEFADRIGPNMDPLALLDSGLGPLASTDTRDTVARAESRAQAVALLVMTPEFLRR